MQTTSATTAVAALSLPTARVSIAAGALTLVLLAALHILSPEFNPSWRMVSEYALDRSAGCWRSCSLCGRSAPEHSM